MEIEARNTQTRVKHAILSKYMATWGQIIINGLRSQSRLRKSLGRKFDLHFVYVDCFAYLGRYAGEQEDVIQGRLTQPVFGSPIIGIQVLDGLADYARGAGLELRTNTILIEQNPKILGGLLETLRIAGFGQRVKETTNFKDLLDKGIATVSGDAIALSKDLLAYTTSGYTWAFYLLDPYGPSGIPYGFVRSIVSQDRHDVVINFMYEDVLRKTGMVGSENLEPKHQALVDNWTAAFGTEMWKELVKDTLTEIKDHKYWRDDILWGVPLDDMSEDDLLTDQQLSQIKERRLVKLYRDTLRNMDSELAVKLVDLRFPDKERTMFYLFLTTHDATGALSLNKILADAKLLEYEFRYRFRVAKKTAPPPGQPPLLTVEPSVPEPPIFPRPTTEEIAEDIIGRLVGRSVDRREVYREFADEIYFPNEVDKALNLLRKQKRAHFESPLRHDTKINFPSV